jgi:DUF1365 family protein
MSQEQQLRWTDPALCTGVVMHARSQPVRNVFHYPIFYLRLPLSRLNQLNIRGLAVNRKGICQILNRDHGPRDGTSLLNWVEGLLAEHQLADVTAGGEVVLQTMPRLFGLLFNPVSFYFCYDRDQALRAVICEVSNTFGERHNYLVAHPDHRPIQSFEKIRTRKIFHVSPFFPLQGEYEFLFGGEPTSPVAIINYRLHSETLDSESKGGLRTWLRGTGQTLSSDILRGAILRFPWQTLSVITKIHWQAMRLWIKKVTFFPKPMPPLKDTTR